VILISHDRDLLENSVGFILHLDRGKLTLYRGPYSQFERQRGERLAHDQKQRAKQEALRAHYLAFVERFRAKATKARQAQSRLKALARMEPIAAPLEEAPANISIRSPERALSPPIIAMDGVAVGYTPGEPVLRRLTLRIDDDDRIALLGQNGNGKSTFAKLLAGRLAPQAGGVVRADKLEVAYFAQHQLDELNEAESPYQHVRRLMPGAPEAQVRGRAAEMGFSGEAADTRVGALSGGEKARLLIGLATFRGPHLLILDEPSNHLDIEARAALTEAINEYRGAVVMVSHDRALLDACAERLWLVAEKTVAPFDGDLEDYRRLVLSRADRGARAAPGSAAKNDRAAIRRAAAERRSELAPLRKRIQSLESEVERLEAEIAALDTALAAPDLYESRPAEAATLAKRRAEANRRLAEAEELWLSLSAEYEQAQGAA
jgi:ATP-binding cassette subfamily F protein 3